MPSKKVNLNGRNVGEGESVYIVAEGGVTNWGQIDLAKKQVDAAVEAGCDAVKFQAQTTEALVSKKVDQYWYERMKYKELSYDELRELWDYCKTRGIQCFITAHTDVDLDFLDKELNVPFFKIGSGESGNYDFLKNVGSRGKPIVISLGLLLNEEEIKKTIKTLEDAGARDIVIMHCNTIYPTPAEMNYFGMINKLKQMFDYPIGYSDHTIGYHMPVASVAVGAKIIEKHVSFDLNDDRSLDSQVSCTPETLKIMVKQIREVEASLKAPSASRQDAIMFNRQWAQQSIVAEKDLKKGETITSDMILFKRPGKGLAPSEKDKIIGKKTKRDIESDTLISLEDVE